MIRRFSRVQDAKGETGTVISDIDPKENVLVAVDAVAGGNPAVVYCKVDALTETGDWECGQCGAENASTIRRCNCGAYR